MSDLAPQCLKLDSATEKSGKLIGASGFIPNAFGPYKSKIVNCTLATNMKVKLSVDNIFTVYRECTICLSEISHALNKYFFLSIGDIGRLLYK